MADNTQPRAAPAVNAGYAAAQIERLAAGGAVPDLRMTTDAATSAAAAREAKAAKWGGVLENLDAIGSRTPTAAPAWVTLEVLKGGFASGAYLAALRPDGPRNEEWLAPGGLERLWGLLDSGKYRIECPEHGVLLTLAWLNRRGLHDEERQLSAVIAPWLGTLQFFPEEADTPIEPSPRVAVCTLQDVMRSLQVLAELADNPAVERIRLLLAQREAVSVWLPLKWELLALFAQTISCGHVARFDKPGHGAPAVFHANACASESCGWPCQKFPDGWMERARALLARYNDAVAAQRQRAEQWRRKYSQGRNSFELNREHARKGSSFNVLLTCLNTCVTASPRDLKGRDIARLRAVLAGSNTKHGMPGTEAFEAYRRSVEASIGVITGEIAQVLLSRLGTQGGAARDCGIEDPAALLAPVQMRNGAVCEVPPPIAARVKRAQLGSIHELLEAELIPSGEVLAVLIPALVAAAQTSFVAPHDLALRRLYYAINVAFSKRRSLLLLDLQHQVTIHELPWVQAIERYCKDVAEIDTTKAAIRSLLEDVVVETLRNFPQTIIPNKLLQSITELNKQAGASIPVVEEVASDIFMGRFSPKYLAAARIAAQNLRGTFYSRYYGLDADWERLLQPSFTIENFSEMCHIRARTDTDAGSGRRWSVAGNGKVIEQEQLLTTHNLSTLVHGLQIAHRLDFEALCSKTWRWILRSVQQVPLNAGDWRARLQLFKDIAFAWRQLAFFFSLAQSKGAIITALEEQLNKSKPTPFHANLARLLRALATPLDQLNPEEAMLGWESKAPFLMHNVKH